MRGAGILEFGGRVQQLDLPEPELLEPQQLLIEVRAAGAGNWDNIVRIGDWDVGSVPPMALGVEAAGVVRGVGAGVSRFNVGDQVLTHTVPLQQGTWAQVVAAPEGHVAHKPADMSFPVAGLFSVPALIAYQALSKAAALCGGETILIHGAGGVTGGMLVAVARELGARVLATASQRSIERVRYYGASKVFDYRLPDWPTAVRRLAGGGLPVAVNAVRGAALSVMPLVSDGGRLVTITGDPPPGERYVRVSNCYVSPDGPALERLAASFTARDLSIPVAAIRGLSEAGLALSETVSGKAAGGVVIDPAR